DSVREWLVTDVVQQAGVRNDVDIVEIDLVECLAAFEQMDGAAGNVIDAECVIEARVRRARIHQMRETQLPDVTQALKRFRVDDALCNIIDPNRIPQRIPNKNAHVLTSSCLFSPRQRSSPSVPVISRCSTSAAVS